MAIPPPKPPRPGLAKPDPSNEDALAKSKRQKDELESEVQAVEEELEALKARYDQYFLGIERREPARWRDDVRKKVMRLKTAFTRNTGLKFRIQSLHARFLSYERLWQRGAREKEEGTYRGDLFKARLRQREAARAPGTDEAARAAPAAGAAAEAAAARKADEARPAKPPAAAPVRGAGAARPPGPPPNAAGGMTETQMRALYNAYLAAKMSCREDVSKLTYDAVARTVTKQIPELMTRFKAKSVDFKVEVKDGKAILKAIPKV